MRRNKPEVCDNCAYNLKQDVSEANGEIVKLDVRSCENAIFPLVGKPSSICSVNYIAKKYDELKKNGFNL